MYLGAHGQANALDVLIKGAKIVQNQGYRDIHFVLIGDGPEKPRLVALANELGLENIEFRESVPKSSVSKVLCEADALVAVVHPRFFTSGGSLNKLPDYMASGRPVIFTASAANNPVEEARCGLTVPPQDPEALADAVLKLSQMPKEEREAMGRRGREYVEKYHAIPVLAEKLIRCLAS